jgi:hypothetical protein
MAESPATQYRFPDMGASPEDIRAYRRRHFAVHAAYRNRHMQRFSRNLLYDLGKQWIEIDVENPSMAEGARGFAWREQQQQDLDVEPIRPVDNMVSGSIDAEFATLSKRQWQPKVVTFSHDPRAEAAAKVKDDILKDRMQKLQWDDIRDEWLRGVITMGTNTLHSFWDSSYRELTWVVSPDACRCGQCGITLASPIIPQTLTPLVSPGVSMNPEGPDGMSVKLGGCPACGSYLQTCDLTEEEMQSNDALGRPLGKQVPKGNTNLEIVTPFEYYPENGGVGITPLSIRTHGLCQVRSLDWIEEHWPGAIGEVDRESQEQLFHQHPLLGDWDIVGRISSAQDSGIYDHHCRVYTMYADPCYRLPEGRLIVMLGDTQEIIVEDDTLIRSITDQKGNTLKSPRALVVSANWKSRAGEFWGKGLPDDIISPQNRINGIDAQVIEARERMGSPNLLVPEGADLVGPSFRAGYGSGKIITYVPSALHPQLRPEPFGSILMPSGVNVEREGAVTSITRIVGPTDIEIGEAPRNITTTSGLQILGEQAERKRSTRERGIISGIQKVWKHQLDTLAVNRVEPDSYDAETPDGAWETKQYNRDLLAGETKLHIEKQAYVDKSILLRESTREALLDQLYVVDGPLARKKLLEKLGLPDDVNEDSNLQIDHTKRDWVDFVDKGIIPVIDTSLDDPTIRFQVFGVMLKQDEGKQISDAAGWPQMLPLITGWEEELQAMVALEMQSKATYGPGADPQQAEAQFAQLTMIYQEQEGSRSQAASTPGVDPNTLPPPAPPPMPPVFLPRSLNEKIMMVWAKLLTPALPQISATLMQKSPTAQPQQIQQQMMKFLQFRSVVEAYRLMQPQPMPAPGSGATMIPGDKGAPGMEMPQPPQPQQPAEPTPPGPIDRR